MRRSLISLKATSFIFANLQPSERRKKISSTFHMSKHCEPQAAACEASALWKCDRGYSTFHLQVFPAAVIRSGLHNSAETQHTAHVHDKLPSFSLLLTLWREDWRGKTGVFCEIFMLVNTFVSWRHSFRVYFPGWVKTQLTQLAWSERLAPRSSANAVQ